MLVVPLGQGSCPHNSGTLSVSYRNAVRMLQELCPRLARIITKNRQPTENSAVASIFNNGEGGI